MASVADADVVAALLDDFNREYGSPTPGRAVLSTRLRRHLAGDDMLAVITGDPAFAVALVTLRPSVWYAGPVAVLEELYVAPRVRGRGIGSALLAATEDAVRQRDGELLEINVDDDDSGARRFYERHGYANTEPDQDEALLYFYRELRETGS